MASERPEGKAIAAFSSNLKVSFIFMPGNFGVPTLPSVPKNTVFFNFRPIVEAHCSIPKLFNAIKRLKETWIIINEGPGGSTSGTFDEEMRAVLYCWTQRALQQRTHITVVESGICVFNLFDVLAKWKIYILGGAWFFQDRRSKDIIFVSVEGKQVVNPKIMLVVHHCSYNTGQPW